ncbi:MAG: hypothetical protein IJN48_03975, partial [Clostridia bacterium]|nr:hypothetical protein [Clostridia bacterium]
MNKNFKVILGYILVIGVILYIGSTVLNFGQTEEDPVYSDIVNYFKNGEVEEFVITESNELVVTLKEVDETTKKNKTVSYILRDAGYFMETVDEYIGDVKHDIPGSKPIAWWWSFLPYVIMLVVMIFFWIFITRQMNGQGGKIGNFGKARVKLGSDEKNRITFANV